MGEKKQHTALEAKLKFGRTRFYNRQITLTLCLFKRHVMHFPREHLCCHLMSAVSDTLLGSVLFPKPAPYFTPDHLLTDARKLALFQSSIFNSCKFQFQMKRYFLFIASLLRHSFPHLLRYFTGLCHLR